MVMDSTPRSVRPLTDAEREALQAALRASDAFVLRRAQIILASGRGERVSRSAPLVGLSGQAVRQGIHAFKREGLQVVHRRSQRSPTSYYRCDSAAAPSRRALLHQSPRLFGPDTSVWTRQWAAAEAYRQGLTSGRVRGATVRATRAQG
jgi:hypothetical protein